jgi:hypothetical protein
MRSSCSVGSSRPPRSPAGTPSRPRLDRQASCWRMAFPHDPVPGDAVNVMYHSRAHQHRAAQCGRERRSRRRAKHVHLFARTTGDGAATPAEGGAVPGSCSGSHGAASWGETHQSVEARCASLASSRRATSSRDRGHRPRTAACPCSSRTHRGAIPPCRPGSARRRRVRHRPTESCIHPSGRGRAARSTFVLVGQEPVGRLEPVGGSPFAVRCRAAAARSS